MPLKAGTLDNTNLVISSMVSMADNMADIMEQVFSDNLRAVVPAADPERGKLERQLLFVAVAHGVVNHLQKNPDAFKVRVTLPGPGNNTADGEVISIL